MIQKKMIFTIPPGMTREEFMNSYFVFNVEIKKEIEDTNAKITDITKSNVLKHTIDQRIKSMKEKRRSKK